LNLRSFYFSLSLLSAGITDVHHDAQPTLYIQIFSFFCNGGYPSTCIFPYQDANSLPSLTLSFKRTLFSSFFSPLFYFSSSVEVLARIYFNRIKKGEMGQKGETFPAPYLYQLFFFLRWFWGLNSGLLACETGALSRDSHIQP
jgi:hypothetical protein